MDGNGDDSGLPFTSRFDDKPKRGGGHPPGPPDDDEPAAEAEEQVAPGDIYATAVGQRLAVSLEFIGRDGTSFSVPYSYLPLLWWQPPGTLTIEYPNLFSVALRGKELDELHRRIKDQRITWVREFDEHQATALSSAVTRIEILRVYPSRDAGVDPAAEDGS
jgi:hypothetical protein